MKHLVFISILSYLLLGCAGLNSGSKVANISETEVFTYENAYLAEYEAIKLVVSDNRVVKWIQPENKNEECRVYVGTSTDDDRTSKPDYKVFWDGECKNGYAYGLGREFERGLLTDMDAIAVYSGNQEEPKYYYQKYNLTNIVEEGKITLGYRVHSNIVNEPMNFNINYILGYGEYNMPALLVMTSPLQDNIVYNKIYPNFAYKIVDLTNNELDATKIGFEITTPSGNASGFVIQVYKNGTTKAFEVLNGQVVREVKLPNAYYEHIDNIWNEIRQAGQEAIKAQNEALLIKKQYLKRICADNISIDFMNNNEYKAICSEDEYMAQVKERLDTELTKIETAKEQQRQRISQERSLRAQEAQANAAQRQANAAEMANINNSLNNMNNTLGNINNNLNNQIRENNNRLHDFNSQFNQWWK